MYLAEYDGCMSEAACLADNGCQEETRSEISDKSRLPTTLFVLFLGQFGAHRFYTGKTETALSMLALAVPSWLALWYPLGRLFLLVLAVWILVDAIAVISGQVKDSEGKLIKEWQIGRPI